METANEATRICVIGSVNGQFRSFFDRLNKAHAKSNFKFAVVCGEFFQPATPSPDLDAQLHELIYDQYQVPIPVYFTTAMRAFPERIMGFLDDQPIKEVVKNVYFVSQRTRFTTEGVKIFALGACTPDGAWTGEGGAASGPLAVPKERVDILITPAAWPSGVWNESASPRPASTLRNTEFVAKICQDTRPRYHFSGVVPDLYYSREPFYHPAGSGATSGHEVTRFFSLAALNNAPKAKAMCGIAITQETAPPGPPPQDTTVSPFLPPAPQKRALDIEGAPPHFAKKQRVAADPRSCFFCMGAEAFCPEYVVSVGDCAYLATPKGPIATGSTFDLGFSGHVLVIPQAHTPMLGAMADDGERKRTVLEMAKFRDVFTEMVATRSGGALGTVTWEIVRTEGVHAHWQICAFQSEETRVEEVVATFQRAARDMHYPMLIGRKSEPGTERHECFNLWVTAPAQRRQVLTLPLDDLPERQFNLQYGRLVMAKILGLEQRVDWRKSTLTDADVARDVAVLQEAWAAYDFT